MKTVLWGGCIQFGAALTPYLPIIRALETGALGDIDRAGSAPGSPKGTGLTHARGAHEAGGRQQPSSAGLGRRRPSVGRSHVAAVLGYLVAGFRRQRLALLMTYRDEDLGDGHALNSWLADLRRLPGLAEMPLHRLTSRMSGSRCPCSSDDRRRTS